MNILSSLMQAPILSANAYISLAGEALLIKRTDPLGRS